MKNAMKTTLISAVCCTLMMISSRVTGNPVVQQNQTGNETVSVYCLPELSTVAGSWISEYNAGNPKVSATLNPSESLSGDWENAPSGSLFLTRDHTIAGVSGQPSATLLLSREIMVPITSSHNPYLEALGQTGISPDVLLSSMHSGTSLTWGDLTGRDFRTPVKGYYLQGSGENELRSSASGAFSGTASWISCATPEILLEKVKADPGAIGFCRLTDIEDPESGQFLSSIRLLPIDKNGNGRLDYMEKIYDNPQEFLRGVWIGKYPHQFISPLFAVIKPDPSGDPSTGLITWILTDGQKDLRSSGMNELLSGEVQAQLLKLSPEPLPPLIAEEGYSVSRIILFAFLGVLLLGGVIQFFIMRSRSERATGKRSVLADSHPLEERQLSMPGGLYFDRSHTWVFREQDGSVKVGIDDFLGHVVGKITRLEMKTPGERVRKGELLFTLIQQGKRLKIHAPVSGRIQSRNEYLLHHVEGLNQTPYDEGWIYRIEPDNWSREIGLLSMAEKYQTWLSNEFNRLKDFLSSLGTVPSVYPAGIVMQEGGRVKDGLLEELGPEVWEEFQARFMEKGI